MTYQIVKARASGHVLLVLLLGISLLPFRDLKAAERGGFGVVIYGATPSGIMAAVSAASHGEKVALVEPGSEIGGMVTSGLSVTDYWGSPYITGPVLGVFESIGARYGDPGPRWNHEPKVALQVMSALLEDNASIKLVTDAPLLGTNMKGSRIESINTGKGEFRGSVFIDASYEGDLMAKAGVSYHLGREAAALYGENLAGIRRGESVCAGCVKPINALDRDERPLPLVEADDKSPDGKGDDRIMNFNFRLCVTRNPANRRVFPEPVHYDPHTFELFSRMAAAMPNSLVRDVSKQSRGRYQATRQIRSDYFSMTGLPNDKFDLNSGAVFLLEMPGGSKAWADAGPGKRRQIYNDHVQYTLQYFKWLKTDPAVPKRIKDFFSDFGLCADEWRANNNWPPLLYIREARRLVSEDVITENDIVHHATYPDAVLAGKAPFDAKSVRILVSRDTTTAVKDGNIYSNGASFAVPYRAIRPRRGEASNLLVTNTPSASHVAFSAIRMEPILMGLGVAAGEAAALAHEEGVAVQDIDITTLQNRIRATGQVISPRAVVPTGKIR